MKTGTKALLGGAAVAAVAACGAAYHLHNNVIPQKLAQNMNASFDNIAAKNNLSGNLKITREGSFVVRANGLTGYTASIPHMTIIAANDGIVATAIIHSADYTLAIKDNFGAMAVAAGMSGKPVEAKLVSLSPVRFSQSFGETENVILLVKGSCKTVSVDTLYMGKGFQIDNHAQNCDVSGEMQSPDGSRLVAKGGAAVHSSVANDGNDVYTGNSLLSVKDFTLNAYTVSGESDGNLTLGGLQLGYAYRGLPGVTGQVPADLEKLGKIDLSSLPEDMSLSLSVTKAQFVHPGLPKLPTVSFNGSVDLTGLKSDQFKAGFKAGYDISGLKAEEIPPQMQTAPTSAQCALDLADVPLKKLSGSFDELAFAAATGMMSPGLITGPEGVLTALQKSGTGIKVDCTGAKEGMYDSNLKAAHKVDGSGFPGSGALEVRGAKEALEAVAKIMGSDPNSLNNLFTPLAKPTEDGKGIRWEYQLDKTGNLTVNGTQLGPVVPSLR
jgi:hypothetical protein